MRLRILILESVDDDDINTAAVTWPTDSSTQMWKGKERKRDVLTCQLLTYLMSELKRLERAVQNVSK